MPRLVHDEAELVLPPIFPAIGKLPASVRIVLRYTMTESVAPEPPVIRALHAGRELCEGPRLTSPPELNRLFAREALADALADEQLPAMLECGARVAAASGFHHYSVTLLAGDRARTVSLLPGRARVAPPFYKTPANRPAGIEHLSCDLLDGDTCAEHAHAHALIPRLDAMAIGDFSAITLLAVEPTAKWAGADPARVPSLSPEDTKRNRVDVMSFEEGSFSLLGEHFDLFDDEERATAAELKAALRRAGAVAVNAPPAFDEGPGVIAISVQRDAAAVAKALHDMKQIAARPVPPGGPDVEDQFAAVADAMHRRGFAESTIEVKGHEVWVRFKWAFTPKARELRKKWAAARDARFQPLVAILGARAAGSAPPAEALDALGGARFADLYAARTRRSRTVVATTGVDEMPGLKLPPFAKHGKSSDGIVVVVYETATPDKVDEVLDALRADGWLVKMQGLPSTAAFFGATRRGQRLQLMFVRMSDTQLRVGISED